MQKTPDVAALPGFKRVQAQVYAGMFPISADDYENFRDALEKLTLNDAALIYEPENSDALGVGFRCGFLGMLHMEIVQERLEREYDLDLITSAPTVVFEVLTKTGEVIKVDSPSRLPAMTSIEENAENPLSKQIFWCRKSMLEMSLHCAWKKEAFKKTCSLLAVRSLFAMNCR